MAEEATAEPVGPPRVTATGMGTMWDEGGDPGLRVRVRVAGGLLGGQVQLPSGRAQTAVLSGALRDDPRTDDVDETDCEFFDDNGKD
jgi:hypothetical protein